MERGSKRRSKSRDTSVEDEKLSEKVNVDDDPSRKKRKKSEKRKAGKRRTGNVVEPVEVAEDVFPIDEDDLEFAFLDEEDELPDNDDGDAEFFVKVYSHFNCDQSCRYKIKAALSDSNARIVKHEFEPPDTVYAYSIAESTEEDIRRELELKFGKKTRVVIEEQTCDQSDDPKREFDTVKFSNFCDEFAERVHKSSSGKWGSLYEKAISSVTKVVVEERSGEKHYGTAFLVRKDKKGSFFLSCAHTFRNLEDGFKIEMIDFNFKAKPYKAEIVYCGNEIDFCVLRVVDKDIEMNVLNCNWDELSFGQKIFSVSTPVFTMQAPEELCEDEVFKHRLNTLWFPMCVGSIAHPWVVGVHPRNEIGELMVLNLNGMIAGASGAPIMNKDGEVVGIYISCFTDPDSNESLNFALRIGSVRDYLKEGPHAKLALDLFGDPNRG